MRRKYLLILLIFFVLWIGYEVVTGAAFEVRLTSSHTTATTGDTVRFTATLPLYLAFVPNVWLNVFEPFDSSERLMGIFGLRTRRFNYHIRGRTSGRLRFRTDVYSLFLLNIFRSNEIDLKVIPKMDELREMIVAPAHASFLIMTAGTERQINVMGIFADGFNRFINERFMGTTYEITGDPGIATICEDGRLRAIKPGEGVLIVRNGNVSATASIEIFQSAAYWFTEPTHESTPNNDNNEPAPLE